MREFVAASQSNFDSFCSLLVEQAAIQKAIRISNESTQVTVSGKTMSVADAVVLKNQFSIRKRFLRQVRNDYLEAEEQVSSAEENIVARTNATVTDITRGQEGLTDETIDDTYKIIRARLEQEFKREIIAGFNVSEYIKQENKFLDEFIEEIDYVLSESNATTIVEVEW